MTELIVATRNKKKLKEIKEILRVPGIKITSLEDYPHAPRIREDGGSFRENAVKKAVKIARYSGKPALGEDSGLCVAVLGGKPGIYSSRFSGRNKSDLKNNLKLLKLLEKKPYRERKAHYQCAVALADKHGLIAVAEGSCLGSIAFKMQGKKGFGYDPLFVIPRYKKTFAQLGEKIKHKMSHRFHALSKAKKSLFKYIRSVKND